MTPEPSCITLDMSAEYSVEIAASSKWTSWLKPRTREKNPAHSFIRPNSTLATTWSIASRPKPRGAAAPGTSGAGPKPGPNTPS